ncbi:MAG: hypothetical protein LBU37_02060, partial [Tannerellaceae bacterium]|nr:hypothetical protein [Tannerellaceae bacterium]
TDSKQTLFTLFYTCTGLVGAHTVNTFFLFALFYQKASAKYSAFLGVTPDWRTNKRAREGVKRQNDETAKRQKRWF